MIRSYAVYQECIELTFGLRGVRSIAETGKYSKNGQTVVMDKRRKTLGPSAAQACVGSGSPQPIDADDLFHQKMAEFVKRTSEIAHGIITDCRRHLLYIKSWGSSLMTSGLSTLHQQVIW